MEKSVRKGYGKTEQLEPGLSVWSASFIRLQSWSTNFYYEILLSSFVCDVTCVMLKEPLNCYLLAVIHDQLIDYCSALLATALKVTTDKLWECWMLLHMLSAVPASLTKVFHNCCMMSYISSTVSYVQAWHSDAVAVTDELLLWYHVAKPSTFHQPPSRHNIFLPSLHIQLMGFWGDWSNNLQSSDFVTDGVRRSLMFVGYC